jgi:hypothetical protein
VGFQQPPAQYFELPDIGRWIVAEIVTTDPVDGSTALASAPGEVRYVPPQATAVEPA